ncbi:MAG TPA: CHASE2 domain-containing protein, partial [Candidatus Acidoferrum sp.]|nr:CHASE2 domain-containing protein [Candidatus Acidoferrum sp.]
MAATSHNNAALSMATLFSRLPAWQGRVLLLLVAAALVWLLQAAMPGPLHTLEEQVGNLGWQINPATQSEQRFSIIAIDEKSLQEVGAWPWSRETMAQLSSRLTEAGVQLQLYDIYFPEANTGDAALADALQRGNAVLSQVPELRNASNTVHSGQLDHAI